MFLLYSFLICLAIAICPFLFLIPGFDRLIGHESSGAEWALLFFTVPFGVVLFLVSLLGRVVYLLLTRN